MNISQHLIVPRGQYIYQYYINNNRVLSSTSRTVWGITTVQDFADAGNMNRSVSFNNWVNTGTVNPLRMWTTTESTQPSSFTVSNFPNGSVKEINGDYVQYSVFNSNNNNYYQVRWLFWIEPEVGEVSLGQLSLGNNLTSDVIENEEEEK